MTRRTNNSADFKFKLERTVRSLINNHRITYEAFDGGDEDVLALVSSLVRSFNKSKFVVDLASSCQAHIQMAVLEFAFRNGNVSLGVALEQLAVEAIMERMRSVLTLIPVYEHDCPNCAFLGHMLRQSSPSLGEANPEDASLFVDLYVCSRHVAGTEANIGIEVIVRFGVSGFWFSRSQAKSRDAEPHLDEAARRAAKCLFAI